MVRCCRGTFQEAPAHRTFQGEEAGGPGTRGKVETGKGERAIKTDTFSADGWRRGKTFTSGQERGSRKNRVKGLPAIQGGGHPVKEEERNSFLHGKEEDAMGVKDKKRTEGS